MADNDKRRQAGSGSDQPADESDQESRGAFRTLAEVGRQVVRHALLDDPDLAGRLERIGALNPSMAHDANADPVVTPTPKKALARLLTSIAASRQTALGAAGVGGLEALAALLEADETANGEPTTEAVCIGFTDIENFTTYTERRGDEAALEILERHASIVEPAVFRHAGRVVKQLGDGLMVCFPGAATGILAMLDAFDRLDTDNAKHPEDEIHLRAGLTVGHPIVVGNDLVGTDVNMAARVTDVAGGGELLVTQDVVDALGGELPGVRFSRPKPKRLKGFSRRVPLIAVDRC